MDIVKCFSGCGSCMIVQEKDRKEKSSTTDARSALWKAIARRDKKPLEHILSKGADINERNSDGDTPLLYVCRQGHYKYPPQDIPLVLAKAGANLNAVDNAGYTALQVSLIMGWHRTANMLLQNGANTGDVQRIRHLVKHAECEAVLSRFGI